MGEDLNKFIIALIAAEGRGYINQLEAREQLNIYLELHGLRRLKDNG